MTLGFNLNYVDFILIGVIVVIFSLALAKVIKDKKNRKCCSGCSSTECANCNKR